MLAVGLPAYATREQMPACVHEQFRWRSCWGAGGHARAGTVRCHATSGHVPAQVEELLGAERVVYRHDNGVGTVKTPSGGDEYNPGTPESGLIDMRLLAECDELVTTVASSYGSTAAAWGGLTPIVMIHGLHSNVQVGLRTANCEP